MLSGSGVLPRINRAFVAVLTAHASAVTTEAMMNNVARAFARLGLGSKESLQFGQHHDAFEVCSREHRLYRKVA